MYRGFACVVLLATCTLAGCGGDVDAGRKPVFPVTGTVTMHGAPLGGATIAFAPQDGQPTAVGRTDDLGKFQLTTYEYGDGAAAGAFRVVVNKFVAGPAGGSVDGGGDDHEAAEEAASVHDAASEEAGQQLVPEQYTSSADTPFNVEVKTSGENDFTLDIN